MHATDEVLQEHDSEVALSLTSEWDITQVAFCDGQRFNISSTAAHILLKYDCANYVVTGSLEHKIALIRYFISDGVKLNIDGGMRPANRQTFQQWLDTYRSPLVPRKDLVLLLSFLTVLKQLKKQLNDNDCG